MAPTGRESVPPLHFSPPAEGNSVREKGEGREKGREGASNEGASPPFVFLSVVCRLPTHVGYSEKSRFSEV